MQGTAKGGVEPSIAVPEVAPQGDSAKEDVAPPLQIAGAEETMEGTTMSVFGNRQVTVVRDAGTPREKRWNVRMGGDFVRKVIFNDQDSAKTGDEIHCDLYDEPRIVVRVDPVLMHLGVAHWEAIIVPRPRRRPRVVLPLSPGDPGLSTPLQPTTDSATDQDQWAARAEARAAVVMPILTAKQWTRGKWATEAGVGKNSVYEYLDGKRKLSKENRQAMAEVLGIKPEDLPD